MTDAEGAPIGRGWFEKARDLLITLVVAATMFLAGVVWSNAMVLAEMEPRLRAVETAVRNNQTVAERLARIEQQLVSLERELRRARER